MRAPRQREDSGGRTPAGGAVTEPVELLDLRAVAEVKVRDRVESRRLAAARPAGAPGACSDETAVRCAGGAATRGRVGGGGGGGGSGRRRTSSGMRGWSKRRRRRRRRAGARGSSCGRDHTRRSRRTWKEQQKEQEQDQQQQQRIRSRSRSRSSSSSSTSRKIKKMRSRSWRQQQIGPCRELGRQEVERGQPQHNRLQGLRLHLFSAATDSSCMAVESPRGRVSRPTGRRIARKCQYQTPQSPLRACADRSPQYGAGWCGAVPKGAAPHSRYIGAHGYACREGIPAAALSHLSETRDKALSQLVL